VELHFLEVLWLQRFSILSARLTTIAPSSLAGFDPTLEVVNSFGEA
jgi:hypothetical protein